MALEQQYTTKPGQLPKSWKVALGPRHARAISLRDVVWDYCDETKNQRNKETG